MWLCMFHVDLHDDLDTGTSHGIDEEDRPFGRWRITANMTEDSIMHRTAMSISMTAQTGTSGPLHSWHHLVVREQVELSAAHSELR
jgi:hypothetical protein